MLTFETILFEFYESLKLIQSFELKSVVFYDSASQNIMFIFAKQSPILQKNIKLSYLKAFFIQEAIILTTKNKNMHVKCSIHIKCVSPNCPYVCEWQK